MIRSIDYDIHVEGLASSGTWKMIKGLRQNSRYNSSWKFGEYYVPRDTDIKINFSMVSFRIIERFGSKLYLEFNDIKIFEVVEVLGKVSYIGRSFFVVRFPTRDMVVLFKLMYG